MASFSVQMDGVRDYTLTLNVTQVSQNAGANTSTVSWSLVAAGTWGSFGNYSTPWSANIGGQAYSGSIPSFNPNPSQTIASGSTVITHDANGFRTISVSGHWNSSHSNIGKGTASGSLTLTRIPKAPLAPGAPSVGTVTPSTVALSWSAPDNRGSAITGYTVQYATNSGFTTGTGTQNFSGTSGTVTGLNPGQQHWFRVRATNGVGTGPYGASSTTFVGLPAPTFDSLGQDGDGGLVAAWSAPSVATGLTGYRLQVATDAAFATNVVNVDLGNVLTHTVTDLAGGRIYYARVAARTSGGVNAYSSSRSHMLVLSAGNLDGWTRVGMKPEDISYYTAEGIRRGTVGTSQALYLESLATGAATLDADTFGIQRTVAVTNGKAYRLKASITGAYPSDPTSTQGKTYRLVADSEVGDTAELTTATETVDLPEVEFVASGSTATIQVLLAEELEVLGAQSEVEKVAIHSIELLELATDFPTRLRGTVYESSLSNHFDLACNSVGASWYVAKDGVTRFRLPGAALPVSAVFSDEAAPEAVSYVDITAGFDTRSTVNRIEATNYGVNETGDLEQNDELVVEDLDSQNAYGVYRSTVALNLYDGAPYTDSFTNRLDEMLEAHKEPRPIVSVIRWNAQEDLEMAAALEVGQRIMVRYRDADYDCQIVSIQHDITPTRWMVGLNLLQL